MSSKQTHEQQVQEFLAKGGQIQKYPTPTKKAKASDVEVVEIEIEALPKELLRFIK